MKKKTIVIIAIVVVAIIAGVVGVGVYHYKMEKLKAEQKATDDFYRIMEENMSSWSAETNEEANGDDFEELENETEPSNEEISPDVKEFLDSYESFMDEYVDFMKKYKQNPADTSMIMEYADMMQEYSDFVQASEELKTDLNDAEMKYYTEVMLRVEQKMIEAM